MAASIEQSNLDHIRHVLSQVARSIDTSMTDDPRRKLPSPMIALGRSPQDTGGKPGDDLALKRLTLATVWVRARDARDECFGDDLFFEPAWNMLLDLYIHHCHDTAVSVSSLCIAAKVPTTTALRWIAMLERRELIERKPDPFDRRRYFVVMTTSAVRRVEQTLDRTLEGGEKLGIRTLPIVN